MRPHNPTPRALRVALRAPPLSVVIPGKPPSPGFGESLGKPDFELRDLMRHWRYPGYDVTRQQARCELVRVMHNDRVVDGQAVRRAGRRRRCQRTFSLRRLHPVDVLTVDRSGTGGVIARQRPATELTRRLTAVRSWHY